MADVELVIKIDEELFKGIKICVKDGILNYEPWVAIAKGTPLPKGHGKIIDVSEYFKKEFGDAREFLDKATTIIEADRSEVSE